MRKLLIGLTLLASISSYASVEDGKYLISDIYCTSGQMEESNKTLFEENIKTSVVVMNVIDLKIVVSSSDECGVDRSVYSITNKETSLRMNFENEQSAKFENACPNTVKMQDYSDLIIKSSSSNKIEVSVDGLKVGEVCDGELIFVYNK